MNASSREQDESPNSQNCPEATGALLARSAGTVEVRKRKRNSGGTGQLRIDSATGTETGEAVNFESGIPQRSTTLDGKRKRRKVREALVGTKIMRKFPNYENGCRARIISYEPDQGYQIMYSDGEIEVMSDEDIIMEYHEPEEADYSHQERSLRAQSKDSTVMFLVGAGDSPIINPCFIASLIRLLGKARYSMTTQKFAFKIDPENFPRYPKSALGLFIASKAGEDSNNVTEIWSRLNAEEKRPFYIKHKESLEKYKAAVEKYQPGQVEKIALQIFKHAKQSSQRLFKKGKASNYTHTKPKRPMSAFLYFSQEERARWHGNEMSKSMRNFQIQAAVKWRSLTDEDKCKFQQMAMQDQNRYKNEMEAFEEVDQGEGSSRKNIQREHFEKYIYDRLEVLKEMCKASTALVNTLCRQQRLHAKLQRIQAKLSIESQNYERWSYKVRKLRGEFPDILL